jgi:hypothetical protein
MREAAARMRGAGADEWHLNVKPDNLAAIRLYERLGLRAAYTSTSLNFPWTLVDGVPEIPGHVVASPLEVEEEPAVEKALGLLDGQFREVRKRSGRRLFKAIDTNLAAVVGGCMFDPSFPGSFPFRAKSETAAWALLRAAREHAIKDTMNVVIEDDPNLRDALRALGAAPRLEIVHMQGPLP